MVSFKYQNKAKIIFGENSINELENELLGFKKVLVITSGSFVKELGIYEKVEDVFKKLDISFIYNDEVKPNPHVDLVRKLVKICKEENIDFILAIGGGSSMDTAKAVAVGALVDHDVFEFFEYTKEVSKALPIGVISTIASSGSEASNCSIISSDDKKLGIEYDEIVPKFAIIDAKYTLSLPFNHLAAGIADISSHLIERYYTNETNVDATDYMIEGLLKALMVNALKIEKDRENLSYRNEVFLISIIAHNNILDSGRVADWASHRIEHELSNEYGIIHGEGMAMTMVAYAKYMAKHHNHKLSQLANRLFNVDYNTYTKEEMAFILSSKLEEFYNKLGLRTKLSDFGINSDKFLKMANTATKNGKSKIGHYMPLGIDEIVKVYELMQ